METNQANQNSNKPSLSQPGSVPQEEIKYREESENVREGARQEDQLESLNPVDDEERKSQNDQIGAPPFTVLNDGSPISNQPDDATLTNPVDTSD